MDLKTLTEINAPSGHEQAIRRFLLDELKKLGFAPVLDRMGNVVVVKEGTGDAPQARDGQRAYGRSGADCHLRHGGWLPAYCRGRRHRPARAGFQARHRRGRQDCPASSALCRFTCNPPPSASMCFRWTSCWWTLARRTRTKLSAKPRWGRTSPSIRPMWNTATASRAARHSTTASAACRCCVCCKKNCRLTSWLALCPKRKSAAAARRGQRSSRNPTSALCWKARRATTSATYRRLRTSAKPDGRRGVVHGWRVNCEPSAVPQGAGRGEAGEHSASGEAQRIRRQRRRRDSARAGGCAGGGAERAVPIYSLAVVGGEAVGCGEPVCAGEGAGQGTVSAGDLIRLRFAQPPSQRGRFWMCAIFLALPLGEGVAAATDEVGAARANCLKVSATQSRRWVKGRRPLQGQGTASLVGVKGQRPLRSLK